MSMADQSLGTSTFWTQANALLRKNLTYQKRNLKTNIRLISFPILLCVLLALLQRVVNNGLSKPESKCGCDCVDTNGDGECEEVCGLQHSNLFQAASCPVPSPPEWPPLLPIPSPEFRAVRTSFFQSTDFPNESCRKKMACPATMLFTGTNHSLGRILAGNMIPSSFTWNSSDVLDGVTLNVLGSESEPPTSNFIESAFFSDLPLDYIQSKCKRRSALPVPFSISSLVNTQEVRCTQGLQLWRNSSSVVNDELYKGYQTGNSEGKINEIVSGFDFLNSNGNNFNVTIWYNSSYRSGSSGLVRVPRLVNLVSNAYLKFLVGEGTHLPFEFVKEMPKHATNIRLDFSSVLGTLFFTWVILQLFPVILTSLVYEKEQKLRIMMKMHGLGDGPYWMITYTYFLAISAIYMFCFVTFGSVSVSLAFLGAAMFSNVKTAAVSSYIFVFGSGLLGGFLFQEFLQDSSFPRGWIIVMELYPGFLLYRGLYEFGQYSLTGNLVGTYGMRWENLGDSFNGMREVFIIMLVEWIVLLLVAYYLDQVLSSGGGKHPLFFLQRFKKKPPSPFKYHSLRRQGSKVLVQIDKPDVSREREKVEQLLNEVDPSHPVICDHLRKMYPGRDGNPVKFAVRGISLALSRGECFGMLGPNGAGKTSFISMMTGLTKPTSGTAFIEGLDLRTEIDSIYTSIGVCPQHDLLWETLTGREHLLFYGRLKNLKGSTLTQAVEESLKGIGLFHGGVADKQAGNYSGGMKRRLSVAISLIGDPKVVYLDEPSTGLDPASRNSLWNVVKRAKQGRAIILTTHSMEEAEVLCDQLGIFVDGSLQCIGNSKELKARYGGTYVFTMTTSPSHDEDVENMVKGLAPGGSKIYHISGTQKFELPKHEVRIADVFQAVENAKSRFTVHAWGLADTTLEDVFIKVAQGADLPNMFS